MLAIMVMEDDCHMCSGLCSSFISTSATRTKNARGLVYVTVPKERYCLCSINAVGDECMIVLSSNVILFNSYDGLYFHIKYIQMYCSYLFSLEISKLPPLSTTTTAASEKLSCKIMSLG